MPHAGRTVSRLARSVLAAGPWRVLVTRTRDSIHLIARELIKFGVVGAVAYVVDVGVFNLLRYAGPRLLEDKPLTAKVVSVAVATVVAWYGNRHWTFRRRRRVDLRREFGLFVAMNVIGMGIAVACLAISHYVLRLTSPLADNISANVVGLALGTSFRFVAYRTWVFTEVREPPGSPPVRDVDHQPGAAARAVEDEHPERQSRPDS